LSRTLKLNYHDTTKYSNDYKKVVCESLRTLQMWQQDRGNYCWKDKCYNDITRDPLPGIVTVSGTV